VTGLLILGMRFEFRNLFADNPPTCLLADCAICEIFRMESLDSALQPVSIADDFATVVVAGTTVECP
jgi:hypothetical protein